MKPITSFALLCAFVSASQAAVTDPVGYTTSALVPGFNIIGINLSGPVSAGGDFETISGTSLTDDEVDFTATLAAGLPHTLRITSGTNAGLNTEITSWSGNTIVTKDNLSSLITSSDTYEVRKTVTIADAFGSANEVGLAPGSTNSAGADLVWVQTDSGFSKVYYNAVAGSGFGAVGVGWKTTTTGNVDASKTPIYYNDAIFIERRGTGPLSITFTGHVVTDASVVAVQPGFNYVNRILPVEFSLGESGLEAYLTQGNTNSSIADIIWVSDGTGGYKQYYYNGTAGSGFGAIGVGWKGTTTGNTDQSGVDLSGGFIIQRKGDAKNIVLPIPAGLDL